MHLKRIELTNFRQHRKLDVDFNGNLIAVLGSNGSGKSNLIGGIQFALTGEQPGFTKSDLTTWGEKEGSVRLFFTAGPKNEEFVLTRKTNGDVTLKVGGETIKQARKVEDALREKAGLDKDLIKQVVFVNQKEIDKILSADPKDRELALQRIAGIAQASKIYDYLRTEIAEYDKPQGFDEAIERASVQLAEQEGIAKACGDALAKYEGAVKLLPSKEALEAEVDRLAGSQGAIDEYATVCQRLSDAQSLHEMALAKLGKIGVPSEEEEGKIRSEIDILTSELDTLRAEQEKTSNAIRLLTRMKELSDSAVSARDKMKQAEESLQCVVGKYSTKLEEDDAEVKRLANEQAAAEAAYRSLLGLAKAASDGGTCPVCGAPASQEEIESHMKERLASADKARKDAIDASRSASMRYDKRHAEESYATMEVAKKKVAYDNAFAALKKAHDANVEGCRIDLESLEVSYDGATPNDIPLFQRKSADTDLKINGAKNRIGHLRIDLDAFKTLRDSAKEARDNVARYAAQIDALMQSKQTCAKRLADMGIDPESAKDGAESRKAASAKARSNLDAYNGILRDMAAEKGRLEAAENTIKSTKKFIEELVEKKRVEDEVQAKVDTLKRSRDWFHYKVGPRIVSQKVMRDLTDSVNEFLDQFQAPFVVESDDDGCGFRCRFIDGRTMPDPYPDASMLSGGQKVALAFAFHLAIYMRFGGQLGFLSLDEPTAYLDDANIEHMGELLEKVGAVARNRGLQIIMATHEKAIMPFLDTKIDLMALKGE